ncbi:InlB B-repeat-containing protein [Olsenella uli]|uniref:InlB B-repeat-containing protein n=2 Tax=Olsenella uli TaxID=133926 RepID=UPI00044BF7AC|nr:InlB B-repeat-containing protein [Olsenella uli]EUB31820.1 repeat, PF09479 [Olsenella uli MSTE5]
MPQRSRCSSHDCRASRGARLGTRALASAVAALVLALSSIAAVPAQAEEPIPDEYKAQVEGNYWSELCWYTDGSGLHRVMPTYLVDYFQNSRLKWSDDVAHEYYIPGFPDAGIIAGKTAEDELRELVTQYWAVYSMDLPHAEPSDPALNHWQGGKQWNPYDFNYETDVLTVDSTDYNVRGDIQERGESSTAVVKHEVGDTVNLDLQLDLDVFKRVRNTALLAVINSEFPAYYTMLNDLPENGLASSDGAFAFVLDLPEGLEATDSTTYKLTGIDGFDLSVSKEKGGKRLVVKARLKPHGEYEPLKDLYARIQGVRSATLSIDGLKVTDQVARDQDSTVVAYAYGAHEVVSSSSNDAIINKDTSAQYDNKHWYARIPMLFAAKQNDAGRDAAAPADKPNLMTYSFRVDASQPCTVTFVNDGDTYASVKAEQGKTIDGDALTDESMPANPSKDGCVFKGWNTKQDGTGDAFDGSTVVNGDMTVYAVYDKKPVPQPGPPSQPKAPAATPKAKVRRALPQTGDPALPVAPVAVGVAAVGTLLVGAALRCRAH